MIHRYRPLFNLIAQAASILAEAVGPVYAVFFNMNIVSLWANIHVQDYISLHAYNESQT